MTSLAPGITTGAVRLLLVEDNAVLAEATAESSSYRDWTCLLPWTVRTPCKRWEFFVQRLFFCDLRLPDMSGLVLLQAFRLNPDTEDAVLALHLAVSEVDLHEANAQIDLFLSKPLTKEKIQCLLHVLDGKHKIRSR